MDEVDELIAMNGEHRKPGLSRERAQRLSQQIDTTESRLRKAVASDTARMPTDTVEDCLAKMLVGGFYQLRAFTTARRGEIFRACDPRDLKNPVFRKAIDSKQLHLGILARMEERGLVRQVGNRQERKWRVASVDAVDEACSDYQAGGSVIRSLVSGGEVQSTAEEPETETENDEQFSGSPEVAQAVVGLEEALIDRLGLVAAHLEDIKATMRRVDIGLGSVARLAERLDTFEAAVSEQAARAEIATAAMTAATEKLDSLVGTIRVSSLSALQGIGNKLAEIESRHKTACNMRDSELRKLDNAIEEFNALRAELVSRS